MFAISVTYLIKSGHEDEAVRHFSACMHASRSEKGNISYRVFRCVDEPRKFLLIEEYVDEAAFEAHKVTPPFTEHIINGIRKIMESREFEHIAQIP